MSEPRPEPEISQAATDVVVAYLTGKMGNVFGEGRAALDRLRAAVREHSGGQPPSDGMPNEPSEEAVRAAQVACANTPHGGGRGTNGAIMVGHFFPVEVAREVLRQAYAAERGSRRAAPPSQEAGTP